MSDTAPSVRTLPAGPTPADPVVPEQAWKPRQGRLNDHNLSVFLPVSRFAEAGGCIYQLNQLISM